MEQPVPTSRGTLSDLAAIAASVTLTPDDLAPYLPEVWANALAFLIVPVKSLRALERARPDSVLLDNLLRQCRASGLLCISMETVESGSQVHVRAFFSGMGFSEDPATGSAQGPLAAYLFKNKLITTAKPRFIAEQGYQVGRPSKLLTALDITNNTIRGIRVAGDVIIVAKGEFLV
jgi:trans-2,3-dihydro-3-hydroxyanthranilate isomerase